MPIPQIVYNYTEDPLAALQVLHDYWQQVQQPAEKYECVKMWAAIQEFMNAQQTAPQFQALQQQNEVLQQQIIWMNNQLQLAQAKGGQVPPVGTARVPPANANQIPANQGPNEEQNG